MEDTDWTDEIWGPGADKARPSEMTYPQLRVLVRAAHASHTLLAELGRWDTALKRLQSDDYKQHRLDQLKSLRSMVTNIGAALNTRTSPSPSRPASLWGSRSRWLWQSQREAKHHVLNIWTLAHAPIMMLSTGRRMITRTKPKERESTALSSAE